MTNARCLTEGVDIPAIDCVLFANPKQSVIDIVQAAGRALRRADGKEFGYILLPLVVPSGMEFDAFAETTALSRAGLRVCPGTSCGIAEPSQHEADRGKAEEGERLAVEVLPILGQSTAAVQPRDGAFDNPALRENDKPFRLIRALHDFKVHAPQDLLDRTSELRSLVSAIGVELHQKRIAREEHGHQPNAPVAILDMGGVHDRVHQQALRVDEKVTLLAFDPFTRIIARRVDRGPPFSALFTLWLSMIATVGLASREACSRHFT